MPHLPFLFVVQLAHFAIFQVPQDLSNASSVSVASVAASALSIQFRVQLDFFQTLAVQIVPFVHLAFTVQM